MRLHLAGLAALLPLLLAPPACAIGIGLTNGAPLAAAQVGETGVRERIALVAQAGLLVGRPHHPLIGLITVAAPGVSSEHLILREIRHAGDRHALHFAASPSFVEKTRRATIYLRAEAKDRVVLEAFDGQTLRHVPQRLATAGGAGEGRSETALYAVATRGLGPFWILDPRAEITAATRSADSHTARALLGVGVDRALWPLAVVLLLLVIGRLASVWMHRLERHAR